MGLHRYIRGKRYNREKLRSAVKRNEIGSRTNGKLSIESTS